MYLQGLNICVQNPWHACSVHVLPYSPAARTGKQGAASPQGRPYSRPDFHKQSLARVKPCLADGYMPLLNNTIWEVSQWPKVTSTGYPTGLRKPYQDNVTAMPI
eukprot:6214130-Pleurochrysis_carterae.AAC.2